MRKLISLFILGTLSFLSVSAAVAATDKKKTATPDVAVAGTSVKTTSTEHNFEDMLVQGKFHFSDEAVTTVEDDKVLDSLIGVRSDFKDRLKMSQSQY